MEKVIESITECARFNSSVSRVILFGSRSRGDYERTSDFDICVFCENNTGFTKFYFDVDEIETFYKIDVLRHSDISNELLKSEIERDGVILYERKA